MSDIRLVITASTRTTGAELFLNDAATGATRLVADAAPGTAGRLPDPAGPTDWRAPLDNGSFTLPQAAAALAASAEFTLRLGSPGNAGFAGLLDRNGQGRAPAAEEKAYSLAALDHGMSRGAVILGFLESAQEIALTAVAIQSDVPAQYGILFI